MKPKSALRNFLALAGSSILAISYTHAGNTWDGGAGTGNWNDGNNWDANGVPGTGALTFTGDVQTSTNNDRAALTAYSGINFTNDGSTGKTSAFTLSGNSINLTSGSTVAITTTANTSGSTITDVINLDMVLGKGLTITTNQLSNSVQHNLRISRVVSGSQTLTKAGAGTLTFDAASGNTFSSVTINGGTVVLDYGNMATPTNLIGNTAITIKGSNLTLKGKSTGATSQTLGNVTLQQGGSNLLIDPNGGTSTTLNLGNMDPTTSGVSTLIGRAQGAGSGTVTITTTTNKTATGIYRARHVFTDGTSTGYDWVTTSSVSSPYTLEAYSGYSALNTAAGTDTLNSRITGNTTLGGNRTTNTLKVETPAVSQSLDLAANTLTLTGGGLLVTGTNAFQITGTAGGTGLTASNGAGSSDLLIHQYNSGGLDIGAVIGGAITLVKDGTGLLTLSGNNTFTGGVFVNKGELKLANSGALNSTAGSENAVTFTTGSILTLNGNSVVVRSLTSTNTTEINSAIIQNANAGAATLTVGNSGNASGTFAGIIQDGAGGGALALAKNGTGTLTLSGSNTFSGGVTLNAGNLSVSNDANLGASSNTISVNGNASFSGGSATYARSFILNGSTLNIGNETSTITGNVSGTGGISIGAGGGFSAGAIFNGTNNTFEGGISIGGAGVGNVNYRASFASLADSPTANGNISFVGNAIAGTAIGSVFEYTGATDLTLNNRAIVLASTGAQPGHTGGNPGGGHQIRQNGTGTLTINTDLSVTSPYAQTLSLRGTGNGVFDGDIANNGSAATGTTALGAAFSAAATSITLGSVDGLILGASISGAGIADGTTITGINTLTRAVTLSAATTGAVAAGSVPTTVMTVAGVTNPVSITKHDAGVWTLSGANTYSGATTVNGGILTFANKAAKSSNSTVTALAAGAVGLGVGAGGVTDYSDSDVATLFNTGNLGGGTGINLAATSGFAIDTTAGDFTQSTGLTATRALTKLGDNTLTLSGTNTFNGAAIAQQGTLQFATTASLPSSTAARLAARSGATLAFNVGGPSGEFSAANITTILGNQTSSSSLSNGMNAGSSLGFDTTNASGTFTIGDVIADTGGTSGGARGLTKLGTGALELTSITSTYTGNTTVAGGTLIVTGNISTSLLTTVQTGATLGGTGTVGALTIDSGGFFSPGNSPGITTVDGNYIQDGTLQVEIEGLTAGNGTGFHDQVDVTGTVTLGGALSLLAFTGTYTANNLIFILLNDDTDAISGTFTGLAQGASVGTHAGFNWQISYLANGDSLGSPSFTGGNDIALMAIPEPRAALLGGLGMLMLLRRRRN